MIKKHTRHYGRIPRFVSEGYALYEGGDYMVGKFSDGREVRLPKKGGMDFIGVKPEAPDWAKQEYDEYIAVESLDRFPDTDNTVRIFTLSCCAALCEYFSNDQYFSNVRVDREFLARHEQVMREVDGVKEIDCQSLQIVTPFGACSIDCLSTGCKTLLNVLFLKEKRPYSALVNVTEVGGNVLQRICKEVAGTRISLYLRYIFVPDGLRLLNEDNEDKENNRQPGEEGLRYEINGIAVEGVFDYLDKLRFD
jgi:hypothetical protein